MREIPLVNIYNYAITYDEYITDMTSTSLNSTTSLLATNPYYVIQDNERNKFYGDITSNNKGFISDVLVQLNNQSNNNRIGFNQRMDTKLVRNILFVITLQDIIKRRIKQEIEFINTKVVSNTAAVSNQVDSARYDFEMSGNKLDPNANIDFDF